MDRPFRDGEETQASLERLRNPHGRALEAPVREDADFSVTGRVIEQEKKITCFVGKDTAFPFNVLRLGQQISQAGCL